MRIITFSERQKIKTISDLMDVALPNWKDNLLTINEMLQDLNDEYTHIDYMNTKISNTYHSITDVDKIINNIDPYSVEDVDDLNYWISVSIEGTATSDEVEGAFSKFHDIVQFCFDNLELKVSKYNNDSIKLRVGRVNQYNMGCSWKSKNIYDHIPKELLKRKSIKMIDWGVNHLLPIIFQIRLSPTSYKFRLY